MTLARRLSEVRRRIAVACVGCGRDPNEVELLAVSKGRTLEAVQEAFDAGQRAFGENRVHELVLRSGALEALPVDWHMIGSVQTNKVSRLVTVPRLALVHGLDRHVLADALERAISGAGRELAVLLQVNATGEGQKHGVAPPAARELAQHVLRNCPGLRLEGVMAMGPARGDPAPVFAAVARLRAELRDALGIPLTVFSLGMSDDLEQAIAVGSTLVRIGTAVFGPTDRQDQAG